MSHLDLSILVFLWVETKWLEVVRAVQAETRVWRLQPTKNSRRLGLKMARSQKLCHFNNLIYCNDVSFLPDVLSPPWEVAEEVDCPQSLLSWMEMAGASCSWGVHVWPGGPGGGCCPPHLTGRIRHYFLGYHLCRRLHPPHTETNTKSITFLLWPLLVKAKICENPPSQQPFLFCHIFPSIGIKMGSDQKGE